jgi:hypothetical protein
VTGSRPYDGGIAALPLAAAATALLAYWLPIEFEYRPNDLGIVSLATQQRYPVQQETFWALAAGAMAGLLFLGFAALLRRGAPPPGRVASVEALGAVSLVSALWLPPRVAPAAVLALAVAAAWLARGPGPGEPAPDLPVAGPRPVRAWIAIPGVLLLGALLAPGLWENLWSVAHGMPDERLTRDTFKFLAETGQHLAWADALRHGHLHGRDFFCLYGPFYDLGIVATWELLGRSISSYELYVSLTRVLGWASLLGLGLALLRRRAWVLLLPFLLPWVKLRVGLALFGLLALILWMKSGRRPWAVLGGALGGTSLLYSQEFGAAFLLCAAVGLALRRDLRGGLLFAAGLAAVAAPLLAGYAAAGALIPMLRDLGQYPAYVVAGYGKLPFPSLAGSLPLPWPGRDTLALRVGYATPAICVGAALLLITASGFDPRRPLASLARLRAELARDPERLGLLLVALFGILAFRSALGRSNLDRTLTVAPPVALLIAAGFDRVLAPGRVRELLWTSRAVWLAVLVALAGFAQTGSPFQLVGRSFRDMVALARHGHAPRGNGEVVRVTRWIQLRTEPDEPVLFLPNDAAFYYLSRRPSPTRFVLGHQMVTDAHRAEALAALRRDPPRYLVWNHAALRVDDLDDEQVMGAALLSWLDDHYRTETRIGDFEIRIRRDAAPG